MTRLHFKLENVYIPRIKYFLSWVPYVNKFLPQDMPPSQQQLKMEQSIGSSVMHQNNAFLGERDTFEVYHMKP